MLFTLFPRLSGRVLAVVTTVSMIMSIAPVYVPDLRAGMLASGSVSIMPNPVGTDSAGEYIEISYDSGPGGFALSGWTFNNVGGSSVNYAFPDITLAAGETFKICSAGNTDSDCRGSWGSGSFTNTGDTFELRAPGVFDPIVSIGFTGAADGEIFTEEVTVLDGFEDVTICEFNEETEDFNSENESVADVVGGNVNAEDIIPPFYYYLSLTSFGYFAGQNFDAAGTALLETGCETNTAPLTVTSPATDGEVLSSVYTFAATYTDTSSRGQAIPWAIRGVTCEGENLAGNVDGFSDVADVINRVWTAEVDMRGWSNGEYCLVLNPEAADSVTDQSSNLNQTATRTFVLDTTAPVVTISTPTKDEVVFGAVTVSGTVSDVDGIKDDEVAVHIRPLKENGKCGAFALSAMAPVVGNDWAVEVDTSVLETGSYCVSVLATDNIGNHNNSGTHVKSFEIIQIDRLRFNSICSLPDDEGMRFYVKNYNPVSFVATYEVMETGETGTLTVAAAGDGVDLRAGVTNQAHTILTTTTKTEEGVVVLSYNDGTKTDQITRRANDPNCLVERREETLEITHPSMNGEELFGPQIFTARYEDDDDTLDIINWAIKDQFCTENDLSANVAGPGLPGYALATFNAQTQLVEVPIDLTAFADGEYCLVVNPEETGGESDTERATQNFVVNSALAMCSLEVVSDRQTLVLEDNTFAEFANTDTNWTADILGASWVWPTYFVTNPEVSETKTFVETFVLDKPSAGQLEVAADNGYKVYLNGELVADRSIPEFPNNFQTHTQKSYDIASLLQDGENELVITVTNQGIDGATAGNNTAGVLYRLTASAADTEGSCEVTTAYEEYSVSGYKWNDENADGVWNTETEFGLAGWEIQLRQDQSVVATATTDAQGYYAFTFTEPGSFTVAEVQQEDWTQTAPVDGVCVAEFGPSTGVGISSLQCNFGNVRVAEDSSDTAGSGGSGSLLGNRNSIEQASTTSLGAPTGEVLGVSTAVEQCEMFIADYMQSGWANSPFEVIKLQLFLTQQGFGTPITGVFDSATDTSVRAFQMAHETEVLQPWVTIGFTSDMDPNGYVYKLTRWKINEIVCPGSESYPQLP